MNSSEYLSKDILDDNFIKAFSPVFCFQWLLGSCRVDARDRFVTAPTIYQKIYTILVTIISIMLATEAVHTFSVYFSKHTFLKYLTAAILLLNEFVYICNIIHVRFLNNDSNGRLYIKMQEIDRLMKIQNNEFLNVLYRRSNSVTIAILLIIFCTLLSFAATTGSLLFIGAAGLTLNMLTLGLEISFCSNIFVYFLLRIRFINAIIKNHIKNGCPKENKKIIQFPTKTFMRPLAAQSHDLIARDTDIYLKKLFACFQYFQDLYKFQILFFIFDLIASLTLVFEFGIVGLQNNITTTQMQVTAFMFILLGMLQAIVLCARCELFLREVRESKQLSVTLLSMYVEGPLRRKAKNMLKCIEETPPRFSVYGMWEIDAKFLLKVWDIATSLIVIELQFAFL